MNTLRTLLAGMGMLAASMAAANAADVYDGGDSAPSAYDDGVPLIGWSGFYAGGHIGSATDENSVGAYGVHAGFNWQGAHRYVVGIEGNYTALDADDVSSLASIRGRIGLTYGKALFYASAGLAHVELDEDFFGDDSAIGLAAGVGFDYKLTPSWSLGTDISYYAFDDVDDVTGDDELDVFTVMGRVTYHLGGGYSDGYK